MEEFNRVPLGGKPYLMTVLDDEGEEHTFEVLAVDFIDAAAAAMQEARERCIRPSCAYSAIAQ